VASFFWGQTPFGGQSPQVDTAALLHFLAGWDLIAGEFAASGVAEPSVAPAQLLGPGDEGFPKSWVMWGGNHRFFSTACGFNRIWPINVLNMKVFRSHGGIRIAGWII
jgi:hypothetical protein